MTSYSDHVDVTSVFFNLLRFIIFKKRKKSLIIIHLIFLFKGISTNRIPIGWDTKQIVNPCSFDWG